MLAVFWNISPTASIKWSRKEWLPTLMSPEKIVFSKVFSGLQRCFTFGLRRSRSGEGLASGGWLRVLSHHPVHCALCIVHCALYCIEMHHFALQCRAMLHCCALNCIFPASVLYTLPPTWPVHCPQCIASFVTLVLHLLPHQLLLPPPAQCIAHYVILRVQCLTSILAWGE